ncbi:hypothetical protein AI27_02305 [Sphingomonas sp. BHC-A]|nr:hypothetical protein AI27_02305 [Sphingomonas sp. BHC-A]
MAADGSKQTQLAAFVTRSTVAIWKTTQNWPSLDGSAEQDFVRKLDGALGIDPEETERLLGHYSQLSQQIQTG